MSKSKLTNYTYRGALASLSKSVKKVLDIDGRFIDALKSKFFNCAFVGAALRGRPVRKTLVTRPGAATEGRPYKCEPYYRDF